MIRTLLALPLLTLVAAAPYGSVIELPRAEFAMATPHLASPPEAGDAGLQSAPVPNVSTSLPVVADDADASLSPRLYHQGEQFQGNGLSNGSSVQGSQQRNQRPGFGFGLNIPVQ